MKDWNRVKRPAEPLRSQAAAVLFNVCCAHIGSCRKPNGSRLPTDKSWAPSMQAPSAWAGAFPGSCRD